MGVSIPAIDQETNGPRVVRNAPERRAVSVFAVMPRTNL